MTSHRFLLAFGLCSGALLAGCSDDEPSVPGGVSCNEVFDAGADGASLSSALSQAQSGDCVVAESNTYQGSFQVKAGVILVAADGATPTIQGVADQPAVKVTGASGSAVIGFDISGGSIGVFVEGTQARLEGLAISGATRSAFAGWRDIALGGPDTLPADGITLTDVEMSQSATGLWASNVRVALDGGSIHDNAGVSLTGGYGLVAVNGTQLTATGTVVEANSYGVVLDGSGGTVANLSSMQVLANLERGVWAQKLTGTLQAPALTVQDTTIEANSLVGLGALQSKGIIIIGGKIAGTLAKPIVVDLDTVDVGDGLGLFDATGDVSVDNVTLENNARSQALVDQAGANIAIAGGAVQASGGQLLVVVQNSTEAVQVDASKVSTPTDPLAIGAGALTIDSAVE
jgi:hypothetical protein